MMDAVETRQDLNYKAAELDNFISGMFVISTGTGEAIGPVLSSCLNDAFGFKTAQRLFALGVAVYASVYYLCTR